MAIKALFFLIALSLPMSSWAQEHTHDGFFFRGLLGVGNGIVKEDISSISLEINGLAVDGVIQIGGAIFNNFILFGEISAIIMNNPEYKLNGIVASNATNSQVSISNFGAGVSYYFMPANVYLSFSGSIASDELEINGVSSASDRGYGLRLLLGKEWWIGKDWALGLAGFFYYGVVKDKAINGLTPDIKNLAYGLAFSATYN